MQFERRDPEAARKAACGHIEFVVQQVRMIDEEEARVVSAPVD